MSKIKSLLEDLKRTVGIPLTEGMASPIEVLRLVDNSKARELAWAGDIDGAKRSLKDALDRALDHANVLGETDRLMLKKFVFPKVLLGTWRDLHDRLKTEKLSGERLEKIALLCEEMPKSRSKSG